MANQDQDVSNENKALVEAQWLALDREQDGLKLGDFVIDGKKLVSIKTFPIKEVYDENLIMICGVEYLSLNLSDQSMIERSVVLKKMTRRLAKLQQDPHSPRVVKTMTLKEAVSLNNRALESSSDALVYVAVSSMQRGSEPGRALENLIDQEVQKGVLDEATAELLKTDPKALSAELTMQCGTTMGISDWNSCVGNSNGEKEKRVARRLIVQD